ncbi:hypothetical protein JMM33_003796 [Escherichia coli]|uniref:hypothetical protein n=3 Tax=Escherichia coli TaxID=562 RepID=UPI000DA4D446|nr:hypothetical protein [Escherichia coli]EGK3604195.1 hypothetical protein [Escherichia coli]EHK4147992.1 hypothetical protein [Escherichia coli]EJJ0330207.1 hypothetical protein [Escherichia coli]MBC0234192.1 hypothetical protein [Escherichia coli]MBO0259773.1 hypothetical protein [Escherichia coli]
MLRKISVKRNVQLKGKNHIKKEDISPYDKQEHLYKQTMDYVNKIVREANEKVEDIKRNAFIYGYCDGLKLVLTMLIRFIIESNKTSEKFREDCYKQLENSLSNALKDPQIIGLLFNRWRLEQRAHDENIQLFLPVSLEKSEKQILNSFELELREKIKIDYHKTTKCIIKCGDFMAEFSPDEITSAHMAVLDKICMQYLNEKNEIPCEIIQDIISQINVMTVPLFSDRKGNNFSDDMADENLSSQFKNWL